MGLQVPSHLDTQIPKKIVIRTHPKISPRGRDLSLLKESRVLEGHLMPDVHMLLSIPPNYSVAQVVGFIKGKRAIHIDGFFLDTKGTSQANIFGTGGIMCPPFAKTKKLFATTSRHKKQKT